MKEKNYLSLIIIMFSITLFGCYHIYYYFLNKKDSELVNNYLNNNPQTIVNKISEENNSFKEEYLGIIEIPKINLKKGFYDKNSVKNNVNNNVMLLSESVMPDKMNSIIYLAAHSGSGYLAFFNNIDKLTHDDVIKIIYQQKEFIYVVSDIYEYPKNGNITVSRNINDSYLVLTTCSKNKNMQIVIVSKLIKNV